MSHPLDDPAILALDRSDMFGRIREMGTELIRAWDLFADLDLPAGARGAANIVVAGMGGSATAGDYFAALCHDSSEIPVHVVRGARLPNYVSESSLVVVASYSGNTDEAMACYDDAWRRGAMTVAVTTGGRLGKRAVADGSTICRLDYASPPRAALAHSFAPLLRLGSALNTCRIDTADVEGAGELHEELVSTEFLPAVPAEQNAAKALAVRLHGRVPVILAAEHLAPVAVRFRNQLSENGKTLGATDSLPEVGHNLIVGLGAPGEAAGCLSIVMLESRSLYHARTALSFDAAADQFEEAGIPVHRLEMPGTTVLEQLMAGTAWGDYVSCYLALLNGLDPTPTPQIDRIKAAITASTAGA